MVKGACLAVSSLLLVVVAGCDANPGQGAGTRLGRAADGPLTAFVADEFPGRVTPFNTLTRRVFKAIRVGSNPWAIAVTPGRLDRLRRQRRLPDGDPDQHGYEQGGIADQGRSPAPCDRGHAGRPDGMTVYATAVFESTSTVESDMPGLMTPIQTATGTFGRPIHPGNNPQAIVITPDGTTAYVANWQGSGSVTPVNMATGSLGKPIRAGSHPRAIALAPSPAR